MTDTRAIDDRTLLSVLGKFVSPARAQGILMRARSELRLRGPTESQLVARLVEGLRVFVSEGDARTAFAELTRALSPKTVEATEIDVRIEADIARARLAARDICMALGTSPLIVQKLATVVSELARNMVLYAGGGKLTIKPCGPGRRCLHVASRDQGGGIKNLEEIMAGRYKSRSGLGLGILGTKRLSDKFEIETGPAGTRIEVEVSY